jgi:hypothetical protein
MRIAPAMRNVFGTVLWLGCVAMTLVIVMRFFV